MSQVELRTFAGTPLSITLSKMRFTVTSFLYKDDDSVEYRNYLHPNLALSRRIRHGSVIWSSSFLPNNFGLPVILAEFSLGPLWQRTVIQYIPLSPY
jgi:hypothetical protein